MDDEVDVGGEESGQDEAAEKEARSLGWAPKDRWRGDPDAWRDAPEFLRRGQEILPIVNARNRALLDSLEDARRQIAGLKGTVDQQSQTVKDLLTHQADEIKRQVNSKLSTLRLEKREAIRSGDHDRAADLEEEIDTTKDELVKANTPKPTAPASAPAAQPGIEPWAQAFTTENESWLMKDKRKTGLFTGICDDLLATTNLRQADLLNEAKKQLDEMLGPKGKPVAKSESGGGGWSEGGSKGASGSFASLPADAKEACKSQAKKFVGPEGSGKAFKTDAEWQSHYAKTYLAATKSN